MAKKRKTAKKKAARAVAKKPATRAVKAQATPAQLGQPAKAQKLRPEDTVTALMIAVAIVIVLAGLYLYQQNVRPKASQLAPVPPIALIETARLL